MLQPFQSTDKMRICIIGGGTVGGGVVEMIKHQQDIEIIYLVVRDASKDRDFAIPETCQITEDVEAAISDGSIDLVVELMGGITRAWPLVRDSLKKGKHVVTANKALISKHMDDIESIISATKNPPYFMYEGAVGGGIPVVNTFLRGMRGDEIFTIKAVINGSTNWLIEQMMSKGVGCADLIKDAIHLGYLEADPSQDVLGYDACSKLCILARIAFGVSLREEQVVCKGIDRIDAIDLSFAKRNGYAIRLVASSWLEPESGEVRGVVMPSLVPEGDPLFNLPGSNNCVVLDSKYSRQNILVGSGAGRFPTANSVVSDILAVSSDLKRGATSSPFPFGKRQAAGRVFVPDFESMFYVRAATPQDASGIHASLQQSGIDVEIIDLTFVKTMQMSYERLTNTIQPRRFGVIMRIL